MQMRKSFFGPLAFFLVLLANSASSRAAKHETGFLDRTVQVAGVTYKFQVFVPDNWNKDQRWPVILFLHGAGERGEDGLIQTEVGFGTAVRRSRIHFPAVVVFPQCRKDQWWTLSPMDEMAMKALEQASREFRGDPQRTYLTGISMGGYGTWHLAEKYTHHFAALVPVCGGIIAPARLGFPPNTSPHPYEDAAKQIGQVPVWIFHGGDDNVVPTDESRKMNEAMRAIGGEVKYTEYPGVGHESWNKAYAEDELLPWLLSKKRTDANVK